MSKSSTSGAPKSAALADLASFCKSSFTLTFVVEILEIDVWHDCNGGWLDLGPCSQGMKIQYHLYPGQNFDLDLIIWPHAAKIWCGTQYGWVRTWLFLERRWLAFTIHHLFPVRVADFQMYTSTVNFALGLSVLGTNAKNDKTTEVFLPPLKFGERRYFAAVMDAEESLFEFVQGLIWNPVVNYIPASYLDEIFNVPHPVSDVRHQDAVLEAVQRIILGTNDIHEEAIEEIEPEEPKKYKRESKGVLKEKGKKKVAEVQKPKYEIRLHGDAILSGTGRIVPFEIVGNKPPELGETMVFISSFNLPAQDDVPVLFVNVDTLFDIPYEELRKQRISQLYTKWTIDTETHMSEPQAIKGAKKEIKFNDHHALLLEKQTTAFTATFLDGPFEIQLRGKQSPLPSETPKFFGYLKSDREFGKILPEKQCNNDLDVLIAVTKIDGRNLAKGVNEFIRGEYPLYPPAAKAVNLERKERCTNDINGIMMQIQPVCVVPSYAILEAQMTLEVSLGLVGCRPQRLPSSYSRLFALIEDSECIKTMLSYINDINEKNRLGEDMAALLTGFAIDTGDVVLLYIEGPRDGEILKIWNLSVDFWPILKPVFSSSARYTSRVYEEMVNTHVPFMTLKMFVPLNVILACPPTYARPALPIPTRYAVLKIGRLIASKLAFTPCRSNLPSTSELKSFRLELCVPPRSDAVVLERYFLNRID